LLSVGIFRQQEKSGARHTVNHGLSESGTDWTIFVPAELISLAVGVDFEPEMPESDEILRQQRL
jgi:hypothetical protein